MLILFIRDFILQEMLSQGLGLTSKDAQYIQQILQNQLTPQISELLEKLTSEEFAIPPSKSKSARISMAFLVSFLIRITIVVVENFFEDILLALFTVKSFLLECVVVPIYV